MPQTEKTIPLFSAGTTLCLRKTNLPRSRFRDLASSMPNLDSMYKKRRISTPIYLPTRSKGTSLITMEIITKPAPSMVLTLTNTNSPSGLPNTSVEDSQATLLIPMLLLLPIITKATILVTCIP